MDRSLPSVGRRNLIRTAAGTALFAATSGISVRGSAQELQGQNFHAMAEIKILAFDFLGSCVDYYSVIARMGETLNSQKELALDWASFTQDWTQNFYKAMASHRDNYVPVAALFRESLDTVLDQRGLSERFSHADRDQMVTVWDRMVPWPDTAEGLNRLKRKFALTTLSNSSVASVFQTARRHALPFDQVLTSELVRTYKPDPRVYGLVTTLLGYKTEEVLFCATHFPDLKEAKNFGYKTAWFPRPLEKGPGLTIDTTAKPYVDLYAADIVDLAEKLDA